LGHTATAVTAAEPALARLAEQRFDAVMTDVSLPGMSGIDLAKELVKQYPGLPVVISSGYGSFDVQDILGQRRPSVFLLPKPYDMPTLERTLNAAAEYSRS
jgi:DNA-binding NtrC family response regulator